MDDSVIKKLTNEGAFRHQKAQERSFKPLTVDLGSVEAGEDDVLRVPKRIRFKPNKSQLDAKYDDKIPGIIGEIKELCQRYAGARIIIEGNVDTSRKSEIRRLGQRQYAIMSQAVQELSEKRAKAVRAELLKLLPEEDPNRFVAFGNGWDNPIDLLDHTKNRRVDVRVIRLE
jgi:outer membrane protein OmpA-like peptidoglycan-associated protein